MKDSVFRQVKKVLLVLIILPLLRFKWRMANAFVRFDPKIMLFFHTEKVFYDNSRYLFDYLIQKSDLKPLVLLKSKDLYLKLKQTYPGKVYYAYSFKGFLLFLKSRTIIISYGTSAIEFFPYFLNSRHKNIFYMGHGIPMKKIGKQVDRWKSLFNRKLLQSYSFATCSSTLERFILASAFEVEIDHIILTGAPRNDAIFKSALQPKPKDVKFDFLNKKVILYAPTWREFGFRTRFFPFDDFQLEELISFLEKNDAVILLRGHKEEMKNTGGLLSQDLTHNRIILANQDVFPDATDLLPYVDVLITDYSGMYLDFLPFNRPIMFFPYDLEDYNKYKGILLDYERYTAGPKIFTQAEFLKSLSIFLSAPETDSQMRLEMTKVFYENQDTSNCERIYNHLTRLSK